MALDEIQTSTYKALDIWLFVCQLFTFVALVEYAVVNVRTRLEQETNKRLKMENEDSKVNFSNFVNFITSMLLSG